LFVFFYYLMIGLLLAVLPGFVHFHLGLMDAAMDKFECNQGFWARSRWQLDCIRERHCSGEALERDGRPQTLIKRRAAWTATMCFSAE
jgi:hypothetical protein